MIPAGSNIAAHTVRKPVEGQLLHIAPPSNMLYSMVARLRQFVGNRRRARRYKARHKVRMLFSISTAADQGYRSLPLDGYTRDISEIGMALVVPAVDISEGYLTSEDRLLRTALELPTGRVEMYTVPVRYEQLAKDEVETGHVIGVRTTKMSDRDRARLMEYLRTL